MLCQKRSNDLLNWKYLLNVNELYRNEERNAMNRIVWLLTHQQCLLLNKVLIFGPIFFLRIKINSLTIRVLNILLKVLFGYFDYWIEQYIQEMKQPHDDSSFLHQIKNVVPNWKQQLVKRKGIEMKSGRY